MNIQYRIAKIWADGHTWTENYDSIPDIEQMLKEENMMVGVLITKNIIRSDKDRR